jgi:hypothetical protein
VEEERYREWDISRFLSATFHVYCVFTTLRRNLMNFSLGIFPTPLLNFEEDLKEELMTHQRFMLTPC